MSPIGPKDRIRFGLAALSYVEKLVCDQLLTGQSNIEIARKLNIAEQTVKFHLTNIYRKLSVANRTEAVLAYIPIKAAVSQCCDREIYTPFCPWCGKARSFSVKAAA